MPCKENIVEEIPNIKTGIVRGKTSKMIITLDFFVPKTNAEPIIPIKENDSVPKNKLKLIIPIRLIGRSKNNEIMGNKMIKGRPTETQ